MNAIINMKKRSMKFEKKELRVIVPLDPAEGAWYTKPVCDYEEDDENGQIYKLTVWDEYYINSMMNGWIT